ncbi:MAG: FtsX-like permease family protein [Chryseotalea sp.]
MAKPSAMLINYLLIALRTIKRNKLYATLNLIGLAIGIACCLLLALYIQDEWQYDKQHKDLENLYRIVTHFDREGDFVSSGTTSPPVAQTMRSEIPEIEVAARVFNPPGVDLNLIKYEDKIFYEKNGQIADSSIFDIFTYTFTEGSATNALNRPNTIVISTVLAEKLFNNGNALGKVIAVSQGQGFVDYQITAVFQQQDQSHLQANFFTSIASDGWGTFVTRDPRMSEEWAGQNFIPAYVRLTKEHYKKAVEDKMNAVLQKYGAADMQALGLYKKFSLEPVADIYLKSDIRQTPRMQYIYIMMIIAGFVMLIACVNFMNLATAKASKRATEIGIRNVIGANKRNLVKQLIGESFLLVSFACIIGLTLTQLALPLFNYLTDKNLTILQSDWRILLSTMLGLIILISVLAGAYPALYMASLQPVKILKSKNIINNGSGILRQGLVVSQFAIAIVLVIGVFVINKQITFMQNKSLGFNANEQIIVPLRTPEAQSQFSNLSKALKENKAIVQVSATDYAPGSRIWTDMGFYKSGSNTDNSILHRRNRIDVNYMQQMDIKLLSGRYFSDNLEMEKSNIIVNESSAKSFGFTNEDAIGQQIFFDWQGEKFTFTIIGVMQNYHQVSPKEKIDPIAFELAEDPNSLSVLVAQVDGKEIESGIASMEKVWKNIVKDTPFSYTFLQDDLNQQYHQDKKTASIINLFAGIALFICCLGLYGLSLYMTERRFKEIGIRKVLGASVQSVVRLMSREYVKLILIAMAVSFPLAWYLADEWLNTFAYHTNISVPIFLYAGLVTLTITVLTVSIESLKAAIINPSETLKNE